MTTPYENLANAIVRQAVKDYRAALRTLSLYQYNRDALREKRSIESFFRSGWFAMLSKLDGDALIKQMQKEYERTATYDSKGISRTSI